MDPKQRVLFFAASFGLLALYAGLGGHLVAFLGALVMLAAMGLAFVWNHFVFKKLSLERALNHSHAEFGTAVTLDLGVTNKKLLPIFGLRIENTVSRGIQFADPRNLEINKVRDHNTFFDYFHLNLYEKRNRSYEIHPQRRGRFQLGKATLTYADPFGFFQNEARDLLEPLELIVFPRIVPLEGQAALDTYLFGSRPQEGWVFTDPVNKVGTRPYALTDSARKINWKATARHLQMQVDVEKPSFDEQVYLFLDQPPELKWWTASTSNKLEVAIMAAASLIDHYAQRGYQINLATNLVSRVHGFIPKPLSMQTGRRGRNQLLTGLALLQDFSMQAGAKVFARLQRVIIPGSTVLVITTAEGELAPSLHCLLKRLASRSRLVVLRVGSGQSLQRTPGLKEWFIEGGEPWDELSALELS